MISPNDIAVRDGGPALYRPPPRDLLRVPLLGRLLRSRHGRLLGQIPLLLVALLLIYDGFTGSPIAPQNLATVSVWVHYRGLVMLALLFVGNLFCMSCPFTIPRTVALRLSRGGRRWPRAASLSATGTPTARWPTKATATASPSRRCAVWANLPPAAWCPT